jgi:hypothetical protein
MTGLELFMAARAFPGERFTSRTATLEIGRRIVNRELVGAVEPGAALVAGEQVYAHTDVAGYGAGFIEHVWQREGVEVARHYMPVGDDRRWRTWSRHRVEPGLYRVDAFGPEGELLATRTFTVGAAIG